MIIMPERLQELMDELKIANAETYYHSIHVKSYVYNMIKIMNMSGVTSFEPSEIECICKGALLHDIGKLFIKNKILTKPSRLDEDEMEYMVEHTTLGYDAVKECLTEQEKSFIKNICLYHHERCDGSGYNGVAELPLYVQIVSICDVYDALTSERIYRGALSSKEAVDLIESGDCGGFSPELINFLKGIAE